jgi:hypothetical protein
MDILTEYFYRYILVMMRTVHFLRRCSLLKVVIINAFLPLESPMQ